MLREAVVAKTTTQRYGKALVGLSNWWVRWDDGPLPKVGEPAPPAASFDRRLAQYLEELWGEGMAAKSSIPDVICAVQDRFPELRGHLPRSWRLMKGLKRLAPGCMRLPWPQELVLAVMAVAFHQGDKPLAIGIMLMFHCLLRPAELVRLTPSDVTMGKALGSFAKVLGVVALHNTKTSERAATVQHVTILERTVAYWLEEFLETNKGFLCMQS